MNSFALDEIYVGQKASVTKTITRGDIYAFAGLVDDYSPVHIDKAFGEQSPFGRCIAHGFLSGALFSTLAGNYLPGAGSLYVRQSLNFLRPVYAGDTITATFEVVKKGEEVTKPDGTVKFSPGRIVMKATAVNQRGEVVVEGEACSMAAREKVDCSRF